MMRSFSDFVYKRWLILMGRMSLMLLLLSQIGWAADVRVLVSIAPLHSLVSSLTVGIMQPELLLSAATTPHHFQLKPSQRRQIAQADLIIWVGSGLETPLVRTLENVNVPSLSLDQYGSGLSLLPYRSDALDQHGDDEDPDAHDDAELDPHFWLNPNNAIAFVDAISPHLLTLFPTSETLLMANRQTLVTQLIADHRRWQTQLAPFHNQNIMSAHDGFQYFETEYGLHHAGAIQLNTEVSISVKRAAQLRQLLASAAVDCVFSEPQINTKQVLNLLDGMSVGLALLDPMGLTLEPGPSLYPAMMQANVDAVASCLQ